MNDEDNEEVKQVPKNKSNNIGAIITFIIVIGLLWAGYNTYARWNYNKNQREWYEGCVELSLDTPAGCYKTYQKFMNDYKKP